MKECVSVCGYVLVLVILCIALALTIHMLPLETSGA